VRAVRVEDAVLRLYVAPQPARQHPHRLPPSYPVYHPVGAAHRALCGAQQRDWDRDSQRKITKIRHFSRRVLPTPSAATAVDWLPSRVLRSPPPPTASVLSTAQPHAL
jgi:hypothetical protein